MGRGGNRVFLLALVLFLSLHTQAWAGKKSYLIMFRDPPASPFDFLARFTNESIILYDLKAIGGIAVQIDDGFVTSLQQHPAVLSVIPDTLYQPQTTHSWEFLGLASNGQPNAAWLSAGLGEDTIIGNVDSGVWPESESFRDDGLGGVPSAWRGACENRTDPTFKCNNKLIGARVFSAGILASGGAQPPSQADLSSPRDFNGHGTHTLSTAGGAFAPGAGVLGRGEGTAAGGSPRARVAAYKACYAAGCSSVDILAAMSAAVSDGVHVLSLSLGSASASGYLADPIAIGAFHAVRNGVAVVCSAGNSGPGPATVSNVAPWILTVGASTMDRDFPAYVTFGGSTIQGQSVSNSTLPVGQAHPIISGEDANAANQPTANSSLCLPGSLDPAKVRGKIVVCAIGTNARAQKGLVVRQAWGVGMVLCNGARAGDTVLAEPHLVAAAHYSYTQCVRLLNYLRSTDNPSGYITVTDAILDVKPAPKMAAFSSRGPNLITPQILKPDITAPGVSVIAAYSGAVLPTGLAADDRRVPYNVLSGTSMSCPHVSGIAGLLKTKYSSWSPAMIKSAIMTTATTVANDGDAIRDQTGAAATPFSYGSGHMRPVQAMDPGLVYDATPADYINFLCSASGRPVGSLLPLPDGAGNLVACGLLGGFGRPEDLNYPSIAVTCLSGSTTVRRRLKNVGAPGRYIVTVTEPAGVKVTVAPRELSFGSVGEEKGFAVRIDVVDAAAAADYVFGSIEWSDGTHRVRSPIAARTKCGQ